MGFLSLLIVALMPVLKTLLITAVGLVLALDSVNLLGTVARNNLNNLVFFVFAPSMVFSNLADTITATNIAALWFMPINTLLTFILGSALGWMLVRITRTPQHLEGLVISSCAAGNLGNLLLIIIPAVCNEKNSPFGDPSICSTNGEAYASLSMAVGAVYIWSYIYGIIRAYGRKSNSYITINGSESYVESSEGTDSEALLSKYCPCAEDCETQAELPHSESEDEMKGFAFPNFTSIVNTTSHISGNFFLQFYYFLRFSLPL